jgi:hypothetical protein
MRKDRLKGETASRRNCVGTLVVGDLLRLPDSFFVWPDEVGSDIVGVDVLPEVMTLVRAAVV